MDKSLNNQITHDISEIKELLNQLLSTKENNNELMTIKDVAKEIGFNPDWIYKQISKNLFPKPKKIGRSSRWLRQDIIEWKKELL